MKQKTSFFNWGLCRSWLKRCWPLWAAYLALWLFALPQSVPEARHYTDKLLYAVEVNRSIVAVGISMAQTSIFVGIIAAMVMYSYMYSSRTCGMMNALPMRRETVFTTAFITGEEDYALVMVQTTGGATNADVRAIQAAAGKTFSFRDMREARTSGTYMAFMFCVYAFLVIIALVTVLNIVNSISMSVWARMKQYGAMRAVGMDGRQMTKMIAAEAATYAALGCAAGCAIGLPLSRLIYNVLIDGRFPYAVWCFPLRPLVMIVLFVSLAAAAASIAPARRIRNMPATAAINEL